MNLVLEMFFFKKSLGKYVLDLFGRAGARHAEAELGAGNQGLTKKKNFIFML